METISLGTTQLPMEVILDYLESLKEVYTMESYDLFMKNCNNFSNDFAMFLVGRGIPEHITGLPKKVMDTPFGQMLRPQIDRAMRGVTQAPVAPANAPKAATAAPTRNNGMSSIAPSKGSSAAQTGRVHNVTDSTELIQLLSAASNTCAIIFFTSSTCAPCKIIYPAYDELAAEAGSKCTFIKVDINNAHEIASNYQIRATPTLMTFLKGEKLDEWKGADENKLRSNVQLLLHSAHPPHPHMSLKVDAFRRLAAGMRPATYTKVPPLEKVIAKMGAAGETPAVKSMGDFIKTREMKDAADAILPDLPAFASFLRDAPNALPVEVLFTAYDLLRVAIIDPRIAGFFAEEKPTERDKTVITLLRYVNDTLGNKCPYNLRLVALQLACNLFASHLFVREVFRSQPFIDILTTLVTSSLLDTTHPPVRIAATSLALNLSSVVYRKRVEKQRDAIPEEKQVELAASLLEALGQESKSDEAMKKLILSLGLLAYCAPQDGELLDLGRAMDAASTVNKKESVCEADKACRDVGKILA